MQYRITVICKDRHYRETFSVDAPTEARAKTRAMMKALDGGLRVEGELIEYEVVNE
ncbi:MAG: hypothetical protein P8X85_13270 [Desulfobacterales bacterium]